MAEEQKERRGCRGYVHDGAYAHPGPADKAESKRAALQCIIGGRDRGLREIVQGVDLTLLLLPAISVAVCPNDFISAILSLSSKLMCLYPFSMSTQSTNYKTVSPSVALPH